MSLDSDALDVVIRQMLDAMRNAHIQMVRGHPQKAIDFLHEAASAHERLGILFQGDVQNEALAGRILFRVIEQRMGSLASLAQDCLTNAKSADEVIAFIGKPLDRSYVP